MSFIRRFALLSLLGFAIAVSPAWACKKKKEGGGAAAGGPSAASSSSNSAENGNGNGQQATIDAQSAAYLECVRRLGPTSTDHGQCVRSPEDPKRWFDVPPPSTGDGYGYQPG